MSSITKAGDQQYTRWSSATGYEFTARLLAMGIYEGYAVGGNGNWDGTTGGVGYLTLTGVAQSILFKVEENHRPVKFEFYHTDAAGNPSAANYNVDIYYQNKGTLQWHLLGTDVPAQATHSIIFGETNEMLQCQYRVDFMGTVDHLMYITPRVQVLKVDARKTKRDNP